MIGSRLDRAYTAVVPAHNAAATLDACLTALNAAAEPPEEIILFDDGSSDDTAAIAARHGARVLTNRGAPVGPGRGRNEGAAAATCRFVLFVDADVVVHADAPGLLVSAIKARRQRGAAFGSYDDAPPGRRLAARYANLRHHHTHRHGEGEAETFWSGLGLVRAAVFREVGGFDPAFEKPSIEDVELGMRMREAGYAISLVPAAQGAHLKDWTLKQLWHTDLFCRALPWSRLIASGAKSGTLNVNGAERQRAAVAHSVVPLLLLSAFFPAALVATLGAAALYLFLNRSFLGALRRSGGLRLAAAGGALHWAYHLYSSVVFAGVLAARGLEAPMRKRYSWRSFRRIQAASGNSQARRA